MKTLPFWRLGRVVIFVFALCFSILGHAKFLVKKVVAGGSHTCALSIEGALKCWGSNEFGQLGQGTSAATIGAQPGEVVALNPIQLGTDFVVKDFYLGDSHTCALSTKNILKCWGYNQYGQLGIEDNFSRGSSTDEMGEALPAVNLGDHFEIQQVVVGGNFNCALSQLGKVKCWGSNSSGQLGIGHTVSKGDEPNEMGDFLKYVNLGDGFLARSISAGVNSVCAISMSGKVKCWGRNSSGTLGLGDIFFRGDGPNEMGDKLPFVDLGEDFLPEKIFMGNSQACALSNLEKIKCWGNNEYGQLALGILQDLGSAPGQMGNQLPSLNLGSDFSAQEASLASYSSCFLSKTGQVKCYGYGDVGTLGSEDTASIGDNENEVGDAINPVNVEPFSSVMQISAGGYHVCALLFNQTVKCWGYNGSGQLGIGDSSNRGSAPNQMGANLPFVPL